MSDDNPTLDPLKALDDIQALVRAALESADPVVMRHDLEMILTILDKGRYIRGNVAYDEAKHELST
jgi:hypothetical protein